MNTKINRTSVLFVVGDLLWHLLDLRLLLNILSAALLRLILFKQLINRKMKKITLFFT